MLPHDPTGYVVGCSGQALAGPFFPELGLLQARRRQGNRVPFIPRGAEEALAVPVVAEPHDRDCLVGAVD